MVAALSYQSNNWSCKRSHRHRQLCGTTPSPNPSNSPQPQPATRRHSAMYRRARLLRWERAGADGCRVRLATPTNLGISCQVRCPQLMRDTDAGWALLSAVMVTLDALNQIPRQRTGTSGATPSFVLRRVCCLWPPVFSVASGSRRYVAMYECAVTDLCCGPSPRSERQRLRAGLGYAV